MQEVITPIPMSTKVSKLSAYILSSSQAVTARFTSFSHFKGALSIGIIAFHSEMKYKI